MTAVFAAIGGLVVGFIVGVVSVLLYCLMTADAEGKYD